MSAGDTYTIDESMSSKETDLSKISQKFYTRTPDVNGQNYSSSQINFNLPNLSTRDAFLSLRDSYVEFPYQIVVDSDIDWDTSAKCTFSAGLKGGFTQLVNSLSVTIDNNQVINFTDMSNIPLTYKIMSSFSQDDEANLADSIDFAMDNEASLGYSATEGEINNAIKPATFDPEVGYESGQINGGLLKRQMRTSYDPAGTEESKFTSEALTVTKRKSYYIRKTAKQLVYNIMVVLQLKFLTWDFFDKMPLTMGLFMRMTLGIHTGKVTFASSVAGAVSAIVPSSMYGCIPAQITPFQAGLGQTANAGVITMSTGIVKTATSTSSSLGTSANFVACFYKMRPQEESKYLSSMPTKRIDYTELATNRYLNVIPNQQITFQIGNSFSKIRWLLIHTSLSASINGSANASDTTFSAGNASAYSVFNSPFSSAPTTCMKSAHVSNFNVRVGGVNHYTENNVDYTYEMFLNEVRSSNSLLGGEQVGLTSGLISQKMWEEGYGYIFVDLSRKLSEADDTLPKAVEFIGRNNTLNVVDYICHVGYEKNIDVNISTGKIQIL